MAQIEISQLPLTTSFTNTTFIPVENANVTQKIEASSIRSYVTTLDFINSAGNVTAANLVTAGNIHAAKGFFSDVITSTVTTGTAPFSVASTTQVPNLYASRAAVADTTTNGLTTSSTFANVAEADVIVSGNNSALSSNLRTVNATVGTFGNTFTVPQLTVDSKGRITAVSNVAITFPAQTLLANTAEITANTVSGTPGLNLTATGVAAGTYGGAINIPQITVDSKGRVTAVTSIPINSTLNTLNIGIPIGTVAIWTGALNTVPDGWQVADGTNGTLDLRDKFIVGAGSLYNNGTTGGSAESRLPSHTHTATSVSAFAGNALAGHTHGVTDPGHAHTARLYFYDSATPRSWFRASHASSDQGTSVPTDTSTTGITINSQTGGTPSGIVTTATTNSTEGVNPSNGNLPPYMALYYIQKMTDSVSINNPINFMSTVGTVTSGGNLVAASSNVSVSTSTGALVVVGGAGIGGNLHVGGRLISTTMPAGTANTHVATTAFVATEVSALTFKANLASPTFTGSPTAPTAASGTANTQIATTAFVSSAVSAVPSGQMQSQVFGTTTTWTAPAGVTRVRASVIGGGGGGAAHTGYSNDPIEAFGGNGGVAVGVYTVTPGTSYAVTVGAGAAGITRSTTGSGTASAGGTTSFASFCSATGGGGAYVADGVGVNGANGAGSNGTIRNGTSNLIFDGAGTNTSATAAVWSATSTFTPGRGGYGVSATNGTGGIGGLVYLEWVG